MLLARLDAVLADRPGPTVLVELDLHGPASDPFGLRGAARTGRYEFVLDPGVRLVLAFELVEPDVLLPALALQVGEVLAPRLGELVQACILRAWPRSCQSLPIALSAGCLSSVTDVAWHQLLPTRRLRSSRRSGNAPLPEERRPRGRTRSARRLEGAGRAARRTQVAVAASGDVSRHHPDTTGTAFTADTANTRRMVEPFRMVARPSAS